MDIRHMRHFVTVAEELHFGRAARTLNIAQPALSQSIQRLEEQLGVQLLKRSRRIVDLTDAGRVYLHEARRTLMHAELARKLAQREAMPVPEVRVGFTESALYRILPEFLLRYRKLQPNVHVRLFGALSSEQAQKVASGDYDVGFVYGIEGVEHFESTIVERAPAVIALPSKWSIAKQDSARLIDLAAEPFIMPPTRHSTGRNGIIEIFRRIGVAPVVAQEASQISTILSLVGAGIGFSLVSATAALTQPYNVTFLQIEDEISHFEWELRMIWIPDLVRPPVRAFVDTVRKTIRDNPSLLDVTRMPARLAAR